MTEWERVTASSGGRLESRVGRGEGGPANQTSHQNVAAVKRVGRDQEVEQSQQYVHLQTFSAKDQYTTLSLRSQSSLYPMCSQSSDCWMLIHHPRFILSPRPLPIFTALHSFPLAPSLPPVLSHHQPHCTETRHKGVDPVCRGGPGAIIGEGGRPSSHRGCQQPEGPLRYMGQRARQRHQDVG